jgi:hypothetical protein
MTREVAELLGGQPTERAERKCGQSAASFKRKRRAARVEERAAAALRLVEVRGCVTTSALMRELCLSHTEAFYALRLLQMKNSIVEVVIGGVAIWCRDRGAAEELISRLKEAVRRLASNMRYATPKKILQVALRDRDAYELLNAFVPLSSAGMFHPRAYAFVRDLLWRLYGNPLKYSNKKYVFIVT